MSREAAYRSTHGEYWQGIAWSSTVPTDGASVAVDLSTHPAGQAKRWADVFPELVGVAEPMRLWIDTYNGPKGSGYIVNVELLAGGATYTRSQAVGPESWRSTNWAKGGALP